MTAGVLTAYHTGSLQFYGGVNFIILSTVRQSDNHFTIITLLFGIGDIKPYRIIKLSMIYYRYISLFKFFQKFYVICQSQALKLFSYWIHQIKISSMKVIHYLALLYEPLHVINHHLLYLCQHLPVIFNKYWFFFYGFKQICYLFGLTTLIWESIYFCKG